MRATKKTKIPVAQLSFHYRPPHNPIQVKSSADLHSLFRQIWDPSLLSIQEQVYILYLNNRNEVLSWRCLHTGTTTGATLDLKLVLATAFGCLAQGIVIAHNHPSGSLNPSGDDIQLTGKLLRACRDYNLNLLDHLILNHESYLSFADEGML